jgi:hypothetical protein
VIVKGRELKRAAGCSWKGKLFVKEVEQRIKREDAHISNGSIAVFAGRDRAVGVKRMRIGKSGGVWIGAHRVALGSQCVSHAPQICLT